MALFTVVYDACVLYPAPMRDLLIELPMTRTFQARWTDQIHQEWIRNLAKNRPEIADRSNRTKELMNKAVPDCLVQNYESLIDGLNLPDPDDRHVLAAAIRCGASVIVTSNLKDFPADYLAGFEIEAQHPDEFVSNQFDLNQPVFCDAMKRIRQRLKNPPITVERYTEILSQQSRPRTASRMRKSIALL